MSKKKYRLKWKRKPDGAWQKGKLAFPREDIEPYVDRLNETLARTGVHHSYEAIEDDSEAVSYD